MHFMDSDYYIFGAHSRGRTMYQYLKTLEPERSILGFFVNDNEDNPDDIDQIRVYDLNNPAKKLELNATVYIATKGVYHDRIRSRLLSLGFIPGHIIPVTPQLDIELRNEYVRKIFREKGREFRKMEASDGNHIVSDPNAGIFIAKTVFDGDFSNTVALKDYESIIQVGTALTDRKLAEATDYDNEGESISDRNNQFSELTALYWIWKNAKKDIVGLEHWRRRFLLPGDWENRMWEEEIDVILPVPLCVMPSLEENYKSRHVAAIWDRTMEIIESIHPEDHDSVLKYFKENNLYSPCNMIIAKRNIISEYCEWLFSVLIKLNDEIGSLEDSYQNRYPGFISERLLNYYFEKNRERYRITYADKSFLS